jgi:hypothetical protein
MWEARSWRWSLDLLSAAFPTGASPRDPGWRPGDPRLTGFLCKAADTGTSTRPDALTTASTHDDERDPAARHRRLLGNGHCTRPLELDCRFQTICEGCGFFQTGPEFVTILRRQRDDAADHVDVARTRLYDELVRVIDEQEAAATP